MYFMETIYETVERIKLPQVMDQLGILWTLWWKFGFKRSRKFPDQLSTYNLLKEDSEILSQYVN
jgi:hypothetical protein